MITPDEVTQRYRDVGLPATLSDEVRAAWADYQADKPVPLRLLPTNGGTCAERCYGGAVCGCPLLIDGSCLHRSEHLDVAARTDGWQGIDSAPHDGTLVDLLWPDGTQEAVSWQVRRCLTCDHVQSGWTDSVGVVLTGADMWRPIGGDSDARGAREPR